jgi:hypothetical protein
LSPDGNAAALYSTETHFFQTVFGLSEVPGVVFETDLSDVPGALRNFAIADDGTLALLTFVRADNEATLWLLNSRGMRWPIAALNPTAVSFVQGRHDAIIGDAEAQTVDLIRGIDEDAARQNLTAFGEGFDSISDVAATPDGRFVFVTTSSSDKVTVVDLAAGSSVVLPCNCRASGLHRLNGAAIFRLSEPADGPVAVMDFSSAEPRVVIIPVGQDEPTPQTEGVGAQ